MARSASPATAFAVAALGIAFFSAMDAVMKGLAIAIGPYNAMLWRSLAGLAMSGAIMLATGTAWPARDRLQLHVQRGLAAAISVLLFFWGLVRVPIAEGVALTFMAPVIALLLAAPMLGERIGRRAIAASVLAIAGVAVIVIGRAGQSGGGTVARGGTEGMRGALAIVTASLFYAYSLVLLRRSAQRASPIEIVFFMNLVGAGLYLLAAPVAAIVPPLQYAPLVALAAALAILSSLLLAWAYRRAEAQMLVMVEYTAFLWAALLGWILFGEKVLPPTLAGAGMIAGGCLMAAGGRPTPAPASEAAL